MGQLATVQRSTTQGNDRTDDRHLVLAAIQEAIAAANGERTEAVRLLLERLDIDRGLLDALLRSSLLNLIDEEIGGKQRHTRARSWNKMTTQGAPRSNDSDDRVILLAESHAHALMDFILPGGVRLGEATKEQVANAADFYMKQSRNMVAKGRFLQGVVERVPSGRIVGDVLNQAALEKIFTDAGL